MKLFYLLVIFVALSIFMPTINGKSINAYQNERKAAIFSVKYWPKHDFFRRREPYERLKPKGYLEVNATTPAVSNDLAMESTLKPMDDDSRELEKLRNSIVVERRIPKRNRKLGKRRQVKPTMPIPPTYVDDYYEGEARAAGARRDQVLDDEPYQEYFTDEQY